ncbi:MAG: hypothetical protein RR444_06100 [Oscillospiraceae bacterium]
MKKLFSWTVLLLTCIAITSCSDDNEFAAASVRDYQTDAQVLTRFVDVNRTLGKYYINDNKKNSPLSYISNKDWQELQMVNPVNRARFEEDLKVLNSQLEIVAQRPDVTQIVFNTYGATYIKELAHNAPFTITRSAPEEITRGVRSTYARLNLLYNSEQRASFYAGNQIRTRIDINLFGYTYYFFEIICNIDASKTGSGAGGDNPKTIVMSGTTSMESWEYTWKENTGSSNVYWDFKGKRNAPQALNAQIIAEFYN